MGDHDRTSQGRLARFFGSLKPRHLLPQPWGRRPAVPADLLDDRIRRDIGLDGAGCDGPCRERIAPGGRVRADRRDDHCRRLLRRGYPLG